MTPKTETLMMPQGTADWHAARLGLATASQFEQIVTPTGKRSESAPKLAARLMWEWSKGVPYDDGSSSFMERGTELESAAVANYELDTGYNVQRVGFVRCLDHLIGCSPDGLVGDDGSIEVKCPAGPTHFAYDRNGGELLEKAYRVQIQTCLWITGRKWCDAISYCPDEPLVVRRVIRDEALIGTIAAFGVPFSDDLRKWRSERIEQTGRDPDLERENERAAQEALAHDIGF